TQPGLRTSHSVLHHETRPPRQVSIWSYPLVTEVAQDCWGIRSSLRWSPQQDRGSVPVLVGGRSLDEERVGGSVRDGAVARALRHDKELAGGEGDRLGAFELDPERAVPAQE